MNSYSLSHLPDPVLLHDLAALLARERTTTAALLAHLAEVDDRRLYLPAGYPTMYEYCVGELHLSEDAACRRIRAARAARQFPAIFAAVADGRLHLSAVVLLAPCLTPETAAELLAAAAHKRRSEIERLLAERFPKPDLPTRLGAIPGTVEALAPAPVAGSVPGPVASSAPARMESSTPPCGVRPLSAQRFALQLTIEQSTHDKLRYAQALLGHRLPAADLAGVLDRALDALIGQLEKRRFAATSRPRSRPRRAPAGKRHIPAEVKRTVWERDGGQCTFVSDSGHRCPARTRLEFDHADPVARGGEATAENLRLRCRGHNQYAAECTFGAGFMHQKREEVRAAVAARAQAAAEVIPWLRQLGLRADEARRAAAACEAIPDAPLEERVRVALSGFGRPPHGRNATILPAGT